MIEVIQTDKAPSPIGCYSQAIKVGKTIYLAGQIALDPEKGMLKNADLETEVIQIFENMTHVLEASASHLQDIVKLTVYLVDLSNITIVNKVMEKYFKQPFPARTSIEVSALPKNARVEIDAIAIVN